MKETGHVIRLTRQNMVSQIAAAGELDASTLDACRDGDPEAQRLVFEHYKDRVFSIALHYLRGDTALAQDATQEVFVRAFRSAKSFRRDARLSTWLYRIVANTCVDELRRRRRFVFYGSEMPAGIHPTVEPQETVGPNTRIIAAVRRLSPKLRMAVLLRYFDDLAYDEIAEVLGITSGTVASRLNRAHKVLARELADLKPSQATS